MFQPVNFFIEHASPHVRRKRTAEMCMWHVIIALIPTAIFAVVFFGLPALTVILTAIISCVATEWVISRYMLGNVCHMSLVAAALTGLLLGLNLPSGIAWWIVLVGSIFAIGVGKMAFGGIGCNIFNPALVGRVFLLISFPVAMTTWPLPMRGFIPDGATGATVLSALKHGDVPATELSNMFLGAMGGSLGEVASVAILLGLIYLLAVKVISWHTPVAIIATVAILDALVGVPVLTDIMSGGLLLGAVFMATDYVTSPMTHKGMLIYGFFIGLITVVIRRWGAYPEGMSFAILIMNGFTPLINHYIKPRRYGYTTRKEAAA